jgi:hypothetical protein
MKIIKISCLGLSAICIFLVIAFIVFLFVVNRPTQAEKNKMKEIMSQYKGKYTYELKTGDDQYVDIWCNSCTKIDKNEACAIYKKFRSFDGTNEKPIRKSSYYIFNYYNKSDVFLYQITYYIKNECQILEGEDATPYY